MAAAQEVEIKFRIKDIGGITHSLRDLGFQLLTKRTHEMNTLYDLPGEPLRTRGDLLRLRQYGDRWTLTFKSKGTPGRHKSRTEIETRVENGPAMAGILEGAGFAPGFKYEKYRTEWTDNQGHVVVDETPIGSFGEIEGSPKWIDSVAERLQITEDQYITDSYAVLFIQWKQRTGSKADHMTFAEAQSPE
jgi:adenylate cyclase, class 2